MDQTSLHSKTFTQDFFSQNIPTLSKLLESHYKDVPCRMLEIGCFEGRSTLWFLENILTYSDSSIACVDTFKGSAEFPALGVDCRRLLERFMRNVPVRSISPKIYQKFALVPGESPPALSESSKVDLFIGESFDVLRLFSMREHFDVIYIDGSHYQIDVLQDAVLSWPLLKTGGLMIFDDFQFKDSDRDQHPANAIIPFSNVYRKHLEVEAIDWLFACRKIPYQRDMELRYYRRSRRGLLNGE